MQRSLVKAIITCFLVLSAGCQSNTMVSTLFSSYPTGMTLSQSVQNALSRSEDPVIAQVHVEAVHNTVMLSGYVKKIRQSDTAEQIVRQVPGVQTVENRIIVRQ